jgi:hypothetical protein
MLAFFVIGTMTTQAIPMLIGFCGWTPAMLFLGWRLGKAGLHVSIVADGSPANTHSILPDIMTDDDSDQRRRSRLNDQRRRAAAARATENI